MMDLSQHANEHVRRAYDFVRRLGRWGDRVVDHYENDLSLMSKDALMCAIRCNYQVFFTEGEAEMIALYILACRQIRAVTARLQGALARTGPVARLDDDLPF